MNIWLQYFHPSDKTESKCKLVSLPDDTKVGQLAKTLGTSEIFLYDEFSDKKLNEETPADQLVHGLTYFINTMHYERIHSAIVEL